MLTGVEGLLEKYDLRKALKGLYTAPRGKFVLVDVLPLNYLAVDGEGDPNTAPCAAAIEALYASSYTLKFMSKERGRDYVVPPLEGLWWADDMDDFITRRKDRWRWRMMIAVPDFVDGAMALAALDKAKAKKPSPALDLVRFERLEEGRAVQTLHVGSYDDEGPALEALHSRFIPDNGLVPTGRHHEIYLSDARKTPPEKRKTILRQPVRPA